MVWQLGKHGGSHVVFDHNEWIELLCFIAQKNAQKINPV